MILKEENKETTKKNKKGLYVAALCGVLAVSGAVYAATRGGGDTKPEKNLVDLNEDPGTKQDTNPGLYTENNDGQQGELFADNGETGQEGPNQGGQGSQGSQGNQGGQGNQGSQGQSGNSQTSPGNQNTPSKPTVTQAPTQTQPNNGEVSAQNTQKPEVGSNTKPEENTPPKNYAEGPEESVGEPSENEETAAVINPTAEDLKFSEEEGLCWPLQGNVIKNYSADKMVYFETLQQFRTNPAIFISGEIGSDIVAAADGIVKEIRKEDKTGQTLVLDIGNGYCLVYGHLAEITVKEGDYLESGMVFAKLAPVTKYYQIEGNHLYFQVLKDDATVNPMVLIQ